MHRSKTISKSTLQLKEPTSIRLQKDLESITVGLESEKRESTYLDEQISLLQFEMSSMFKPNKTFQSTLKSNISLLGKKLENEVNQLNQSRFQNKQLREKINEYRLDKCAHKQSLTQIQETFHKTSCMADERYDEIVKQTEEFTTESEKIGMIRSKSASQKSKYDSKISTLITFLRTGNSKSKFAYEDRNYSSQSIEVITVLKRILRKSESTTADKKKQFDQYVRHVNYLATGFQQIKAATGMNNINDIVTACVKSEEQSQAILFYFNGLSSEIDMLQETLAINTDKIKLMEGIKEQGSLNVKEFLQRNDDNFKNLQRKIKEKQEEVTSVSGIFKRLLPVIVKMYKLLEMMGFRGQLSSDIDIDDIDRIDQENTDLILGQIEELINYLLVAVATRNQSPMLLHHHLARDHRGSPRKNSYIRDLIEEQDVYDEQELEDVKIPISIIEMKKKAYSIFEKRKDIVKGKSTTPDSGPRAPRRKSTYRETVKL